jgi:flagellar biosynthetic protein FliP
MHQTSTINFTGAAAGVPGAKRRFLRHFGEMVLAMFAGMVALGGLAQLVFASLGGSFSDASGAVQVLFMGFNMTVPMAAWMNYRGHDRARNAEMAASMIVPTLLAAALAASGALQAAGALGVQHAVMIPAMLGVMLWRYEHYAHPHA